MEVFEISGRFLRIHVGFFSLREDSDFLWGFQGGF